MRWHVLGAGAIGGLFATRLARAGIPTTLLLRSTQQLEAFDTGGRTLVLETGQGTESVAVDAEPAAGTSAIDHLLITTKAYATDAALERVLPRLHAGSEILLLQNGCGQQQALAQRLPGLAIWAGTTTSGVRRLSPFHLRLAGEGETRIGAMTAAARGLPGGWDRLAHPLHLSDDIERTLWQKLAINAAINPLTALAGCPNGTLLESGYDITLRALCAEIEAIAQAAGRALFDTPLIEQVHAVARTTAANRSSMLEDISAGRRTEIDQITGYLCQQARRHGIAAPINERLLHDIHILEGNNMRDRSSRER